MNRLNRYVKKKEKNMKNVVDITRPLLILTLTIILALSSLLAGCSQASDFQSYKYSNPKDGGYFKLTKSECSEGLFKMYISDTDMDFGKCDLTAYDSSFNLIESNFITSYKAGVYSIKGLNAEQISGVVLSFSSVRYYLRYLDTDQFAILREDDATDAGWIMEGDADKYYTQEELDAAQARIDENSKKQRETFEQFEGRWVCTTNDNKYVEFISGDNGRVMNWNRDDGNDGYRLDTVNVDSISVIDGVMGKELEILDGIDWGMRMTFELSEDESMLIDRKLYTEDIYIKENQTPEGLDLNQKFFMDELGFDENRALGAAYAMQKVGVGILSSWDNKDGDDKAYSIELINSENMVYTVTFSNDNYIGTIMSAEGILLYYGLD